MGEVFARALKPFAARCRRGVEPAARPVDLATGRLPVVRRPRPSSGILLADGDRRLVCERCTSRWPWPAGAVPVVRRGPRRTSDDALGTPDGQYQLSACDSCRRYLKSCDERHLGRPTLPWVDSVATMPLDAAAMQRGYGS